MQTRWAWLVAAVALACGACGDEEWKCTAPTGSVATDGSFSLSFVGKTASYASDDMDVRITQASATSIALWACQKRDGEMWEIELTVDKPAALTVPATITARGARLEALVRRYDEYHVLDDALGITTASSWSGALEAFDADTRELALDGEVAEPCPEVQCQASRRSLSIEADLSWSDAP